MSRNRSFGALDGVLIVLVGSTLVAGAVRSHHFVPEPDPETLEIEAPAIEPRDLIYGVAAPEPGVLWLAGNHGKVVRSDDGGITWQVQETPGRENLQDLAAWDGRRAVAVGNDGLVMRTGDGGATWDEVEVPRSEIVNKLLRVEAYGEATAWTVGAGGMILVSRDAGATWERRSPREDVAWNGVSFVDAERGLVVGEFGRILATDDGGATWDELASPVERSLMDVELRDLERGVAVGLDGLLLVTDDGGETWTVTPSGTPVHLYTVSWRDGRWMAAGDGGVILEGDEAARRWKARPLGDHELGWHTGLARDGEHLVLVGASQGRLVDGAWNRFGS